MKSLQKRLTKNFFNEVADEWYERTYDPGGTFQTFPSNRARMEAALREISRLKTKGSFLDIGCGTGHLVTELLKRGVKAQGIDVAPRMVEEARSRLTRLHAKGDPEHIFQVADLADFSPSERYAAAAGLGLLEYLETDVELFRFLKRILRQGGYALVECRNKLFNLFSGNQYTAHLVKDAVFPRLVEEYARVARFSPETYAEIPKLQTKVFRNTAGNLAQALKDKKWFATSTKRYTPYPKTMVRRQHTPEELERSAKKFGLKLEYVVYWHLHPYPPLFERHFPRIYNNIAYLMAPLGRTPAGAGIASSFIAVLKKQ